MKTSEDYLNEAYSIIVQNQSNEHKDVDPVLLKAFKAYALQEVKKHLEIAAVNSTAFLDIHDYLHVNLKSITEIEINLT